MPWSTPSLTDLRTLNRDNIVAALRAGPIIPNSALRVMADANAGLGYLTLLYIDWLAKQLLPDTAETEWLDRHGVIWLKNADGSKGRKVAAFASGTAAFTGFFGTVVPAGTQVLADNITYQTTQAITIGSAA